MTDRREPDDTSPALDSAGPGQAEPGQAAPGQAAPEQAAPEQEAPEPAATELPEPEELEPTEPEPTGSEPDGPSSLEAAAFDIADDSVPRPVRRLTKRGAIVIGARGIAGLVALAVSAVAVIGATVIAGPGYRVVPPVATVNPVAAAQQRLCPGPFLRLGDDSGQGATVASSVGQAAARFQGIPGAPRAASLTATENTAGAAPLVLTLPPGSVSSSPPAIAGSQSQDVASRDIAGLAAAECAEVSGDIWLVGGATDVGRTTLITVSNPTTVSATVGLTVFGGTGPVAAPGLGGIVVPPGTQRIFSLAGFAPGLAAPVVRVQSRGGLVVANLQQTTVRTLASGGVDVVGATAAPSISNVIPGLVVSASAGLTAAQAQLGFADLTTTLRLLAPGADAGGAMITVTQETPPAGGLPPAAPVIFEVELAAGQVAEFPIPGLADGSYTVSVRSSVPVVAGVRVSTIGTGGVSDFAWLGAATPLGATALVSVAAGPSPVLHLANPGAAAATATVSTAAGPVALLVPAGGAASTAVQPGSDLTVSGPAGLAASVSYLGDGRIAGFRLTPPGPASAPIVVYR